MVHPFEAAGLGRAPYRCVGMAERTYQAAPGLPVQAGGCCKYCSNGIRYAYIIRGSDGVTFDVGCDCVEKVDAELYRQTKRARRAFAKDKRETGRRELRRLSRMQIRASRREALAPHYDLLRACWARRAHDLFRSNLREILRTGVIHKARVEFLRSEIARQEAEAIEKARRAASIWIGEPKQRIEATLTCTTKISGGDPFSPWTLSLLIDAAGNSLLTFGRCPLAKGETARCKFTVKEHGSRNGEKQTQILRIARID